MAYFSRCPWALRLPHKYYHMDFTWGISRGVPEHYICYVSIITWQVCNCWQFTACLSSDTQPTLLYVGVWKCWPPASRQSSRVSRVTRLSSRYLRTSGWNFQQQQETYHFCTASRPVLGPTQLITHTASPPPPHFACVTCTGTALPCICTAPDGIHEWLMESLITHNIISTLDTPFCFIHILQDS
jgi:hypothetical protein